MLIKPRKYWTEEQIIKEVKKFDSLTDWFYKSRSSYSAAKKKIYLKMKKYKINYYQVIKK